MKKTIFTLLGIAAILLSACSDSGSKTITVSDTKIYDHYEEDRGSDEEQEMQRIISVVPGDYELTWARSEDAPDLFLMNLTIKLKHDAVLNTDEFEFSDNNDYFKIDIEFLNEAGNKIEDFYDLVPGTSSGDSKERSAMVKSMFNNEIGTVIEIPFFSYYMKSMVERLDTEVHGIRVTYYRGPHRLK